MSFQLPDPKVPIFPGINDAAIEPTAQSAGNGAHLIQQHNLLVDILNFTLNAQPQSDPINYRSLNEILTLTQATEWYVDPVNGRDDNDGLSLDTAFLTLEKASVVAAGYFNPFRHRRTINLLPGIYNEQIYLAGNTNNEWRGGIRILGDSSNPENVVMRGTLYHTNGGYYWIHGITFAFSNGSGTCLDISNSVLEIGKVQFTGEASIHINAANHARVRVIRGYTIAGSAIDSHISIDSFSCFDFMGTQDSYCEIQITDNLSFGTFTRLTRSSYLSTKLTVFGNSAVGNKFSADNNSTIDTNGEDISFFPGDTPGVLTKNSYYL